MPARIIHKRALHAVTKMLLCVILTACALLSMARAEEKVSDLTIMIYMCGSNLESEYGSASADIQEMINAQVDTSRVNVLVMAGGTARWNSGFDPGEISIAEIGARGMRVIWRQQAASMGDAATLKTLLDYGVKNRPARDYGLIFWNHGGGPMEGLCWDELFSMDPLSLEELGRGIAESGLEGKLRFVGFDACLMCSVEVAHALAPYAEYMIASQETEPATGWNYTFLTGIADDESGAETGRRIVDSYFDSLEGSNDILTLACVDLSRISDLEAAMDESFSKLSARLTQEDFAELSRARSQATGFGQPVRGVGIDGYDLVDLKALGESTVKADALADR